MRVEYGFSVRSIDSEINVGKQTQVRSEMITEAMGGEKERERPQRVSEVFPIDFSYSRAQRVTFCLLSLSVVSAGL